TLERTMPTRVNGVIPEDISLDSMSGQELLSVVLGKHHIELVFDGSRLTVESGYEISAREGIRVTVQRESLRRGAAALADLVGLTISSADWARGVGLQLKWSDSSTLLATIDSSGLESFSFSLPGEPGLLVV
ncbi:hypothetical protein, partial [Paucibacter sp. DJ2R-2]|uniref:hypothetical protein n=1 Tax=Paucibacter sp. DJ2R-2 TaxID=2893558 RepID=UPI0021E49498